MFSLWTAIARIDDSSQLHLVTRCRSIVDYYQSTPTITIARPVERDPHRRDYNARISSGILASRYRRFQYSISKAILALLNRVIEYL